MDLFGANPVDVVVLIVVVVSALLALVRGFVAEVLSIVGWIAASFAVLYGLGPLKPYMAAYMHNELMAGGASASVLFVGTLAIMSAISYSVSRMMRTNHLSAVDRSLGFLFGLVRGGLLVCLLYICITFVFPPPKTGETMDPSTMQSVLMTARTQPALAAGAKLLQSFAPNKTIAIEDITQSPIMSLIQPKLEKKTEDTTPPANKGYGDPARDSLTNIIDRVESQDDEKPEPAPPSR